MSNEMEVVGGVYTLTTIEEQIKYANFLISKRLVSDTFKDPAQLMVAIQLCKDLKLPNSCLKDFYVINGKPAIFGDTFVALALGSGVIEEHQINFYDESGEDINIPHKGDKLFSCVIVGKRKGSSLTSSVSFSMDDLASSGNNNPNFKKHPRDMLYRRAMGRFIKWICADAIRGIEMADYAEEAVEPKRLTMAQQIREDVEIDYPTPPEEKVVGPLYRVKHGTTMGHKQLWQFSLEECEAYLEKLASRKNKTQWQVDLCHVLTEYITRYDEWNEMRLELQENEK